VPTRLFIAVHCSSSSSSLSLLSSSMQLFNSIRYYLSPTLTPEKREFLQYTLENNGAKAAGLSEATHVVSNSDRFEGWQDVGEECVVVTVRIIHHLLAVLIEFHVRL
jgi:hypothetical protein